MLGLGLIPKIIFGAILSLNNCAVTIMTAAELRASYYTLR